MWHRLEVGQAGSVEEKDVLAMLQAWGYAESQRSAFSSSGANEMPKLSDNLGLVRTYTVTATTVNTPTTATTATAEAVRIALTPLEKNGNHVAPPWAGGMLCGCISVIYRYHCPGRVELAAPAPPRGCCTGLSVGRT